MSRFSHRSTIGKYHYNSPLRLFFILLLVVALPVFIWAVLTQRIELKKRAATSDQSTCWNRVQQGQGGTPGNYYWPNGCKGNPNAQVCTQAIVNLTEKEMRQYKIWISQGSPLQPVCGMATETPKNSADLDNNGRVNITDYILFMKAWWLKDTTRGDLNHDGKISVIDYTLFMNEWNAAK